jgi:hypothetical protein
LDNRHVLFNNNNHIRAIIKSRKTKVIDYLLANDRFQNKRQLVTTLLYNGDLALIKKYIRVIVSTLRLIPTIVISYQTLPHQIVTYLSRAQNYIRSY